MNEFKDSSPAFIARKTLQRLVSSKLPPTPDNYHKMYHEIAGNINDQMTADTKKILAELAAEFPRHTKELVNIANSLEQSIHSDNWKKYKKTLLDLAELSNKPIPDYVATKKTSGHEISWRETIQMLLAHLNADQGKSTLDKKCESLQQILANHITESEQLNAQIRTSIESWTGLAKEGSQQDVIVEHEKNIQPTNHVKHQLAELFAHILELVALVPTKDTGFANESNDLAQKVRAIQNDREIEQVTIYYQKFIDKFEYALKEDAKLKRSLLRLLNKFIDSTHKLLIEDEWAKNQITRLREVISRPLDHRLIAQAECDLEEIIQGQVNIKLSLSETRITLKKMVTCLIGNIEELSGETGEFHNKIEKYTDQISQTDDLETLNQLLAGILNETSLMQKSARHFRAGFISTRTEMDLTQQKINQLESELQQMSKKIHEDHLTGTLNRRGLDVVFEREASSARRQKTPLSYALIDIDNFKIFNDTYGHAVGDDALVFLVDSVKSTTRAEDIIARYGGEEFVILLPNTKLKDAIDILHRIRRTLTKHFFLYEKKKLLITFSAGVAEYSPPETQEAIFKRTDDALYRAKKNGKNLILEAQVNLLSN